MPNVKISQLPFTGSVCANALVPIVQGGVTYSAYSSELGVMSFGSGHCSTIRTGVSNTASACYSAALGGQSNIASGNISTVVNGNQNTSSGCYSFIGNGIYNVANSTRSAILGGQSNNTCGFADVMILGSCLNATQACTTFTNCLSASNLTQSCQVCVSANSVLVNYTPPYGSFYDTTTQSATLINTEYLMQLNNTYSANNVSVVSGSQIKVAEAGVYNIEFSAQLYNLDGGKPVITIWLKKNGNNEPNTATDITLNPNDSAVAAWNFYISLNANEFVELAWSTTNIDGKLLYQGGRLTPTRPAVPSLIVTIEKIN